MQLITNEYRKLNENLHNKNLTYGTCGFQYSDAILQLSKKLNTEDILDYGCGKCTLANSLPFQIHKYDPAIRAFSEDPDPADIVVCTDVMEHIEPELLDNVLAHLKSKTKKIIYLVISTREAQKKLEDGRNAHLIVKDAVYWFAKISEYFDILTLVKQDNAIEITAHAFIRQEPLDLTKGKHHE